MQESVKVYDDDDEDVSLTCDAVQVTQDPRMVLPLQWEELRGLGGEAELELAFSSMAKQIQGLLAQRDTHLEVVPRTHTCTHAHTHTHTHIVIM